MRGKVILLERIDGNILSIQVRQFKEQDEVLRLLKLSAGKYKAYIVGFGQKRTISK